MRPYSIHHVEPRCSVCGTTGETVDRIQDGAAVEVCVPCGNRLENGCDALRWVETEGHADAALATGLVRPCGGHWEHSRGGQPWRRIGGRGGEASKPRKGAAFHRMSGQQMARHAHSRPVSVGGREYPSISEAARREGLAASAIARAAKGGGTVRGEAVGFI